MYNSPLMPITGHAYFPPGEDNPHFCSWMSQSPACLHHCTTGQALTPLSAYASYPTLSRLDHWKYQQLAQFVKTIPRPFRSLADLNPVEAIFALPQLPRGCISLCYKAILALQTDHRPSFLYNWETDLNSPLSENQSSTVLRLTHSSSISTRTAEANYKLLTRWHYSPVVLHKMFPAVSPLCWRGCGEKATHAHIWWQCPFIKPFWLEVRQWIECIQGTALRLDPWVMLFHCTAEPVGRYKKSITPHLLNAAKMLIPKFWKQPPPPPLSSGCWQ